MADIMDSTADHLPIPDTLLSPPGPGGVPSTLSTPPLSIDLLIGFINRLVSILLDSEYSPVEDELSKNLESRDRLANFISDSNASALFVGYESSDPTKPRIVLSFIPILTQNDVASLALIKRSQTLEASRSVGSQLQVLNIAQGANPYQVLHAYVQHGVTAVFDAVVRGESDAVDKSGIPLTKRKLAELSLSLLHLQQNVEISSISLPIHPVIAKALERARLLSRRASLEDVGLQMVTDSSFLNRLQSDVNSWIKEIQKITKLDRDPANGSASQEINFWISMERALAGIEDQLKSDAILLTLDILKHNKRFHATVSFLADTGLKEAMEKVAKYNQLMKEFPLDELLSARDIGKVREAIILIFGHLNKKLRLSPYPIRRALPLVEAISKDLNDQLLKVLGGSRVMMLGWPDFDALIGIVEDVFLVWDDQVKEFINLAREVTRKRSEKFLPIKINHFHIKLQERIDFVKTFRKQHQMLSETIERVMTEGEEGKLAVEEVKTAFKNVHDVDVLDVTIDGTDLWVAAENLYNEQVSRVENQIISILRARLAAAKNANEMFRVFSKFNALFIRPKIRGAIQEYQTRLIDSVKEDIRKLQEKFKTQYRGSEAFVMSQVRDTPQVSGAITWARQIDRQLTMYMRRVEDVLGKGWELYAEGQKLAIESNSFKRKIDTKPIYDQWLSDIMKRELHVSGRIFDIGRNRAAGNQLQLTVTFDPQVILLFKEVRNLIWMGFQVPHQISNVAKDAKRVYPVAVSLSETIRTFTTVNTKLSTNSQINSLLASYKKEIQYCISKGMNLKWDYFVTLYAGGLEQRHVFFVKELSALVSLYHDKVNAALSIQDEINLSLEDLKNVKYVHDKFTEILLKVQSLVDKLNLENYANLDQWVQSLDKQIEGILLTRLEAAVQVWIYEFTSVKESRNRVKTAPEPGHPQFDELILGLRIRNQVMFVDPPVEAARLEWYFLLQKWLHVVCSLKRVQSARYQIGLDHRQRPFQQNYHSLAAHLPKNLLQKTYSTIEKMVGQARDYLDTWLNFQSLWDLESSFVDMELADDLGKWQRLVLEVKRSRATFDNTETRKAFGPLLVDYSQVQSKVNAKYDTWQRDVLNKFGQRLGDTMRYFYSNIGKSRYNLEQQSVDSSSTAEAVSFITFVQDLKRKMPKWMDEMDLFRLGQKTLEKQRYQFPNTWLYIDQLEGEWSAYNEILDRKNAAILKEMAGLQVKIVAEDKLVEERIREISGEWEKCKPVKGDINPDVANSVIMSFESRLERLKEEYDLVRRAKEALGLDLVFENKLEPILEEVRELKSVWTTMSGIWSTIDGIKESSWTSVVPRKLRQQLDGLLTSLKNMPSRMRQYAVYEYAQDVVKVYLKVNSLIGDLRSEAIKERHWRQIIKVLRIEDKFLLSGLVLGDVWGLDLQKNGVALREVISAATGELALEEFLKQVKEFWSHFVLELVDYQNKCRLIKGWDDLFSKCSEHLNNMQAMKHSPHFKEFEEEASNWEDRLNRIFVLFDVWINVQRQWVYLEGIFTGNADIKHLLPVETSRFQNINAEFMAVMKKVYKSPFVLDVLHIQNVQKSLERLAELLSKIQKALGEYLERERSQFPRFYFVGDEDLLEIIGNSKDVFRIQKHFKKMFAGVATVVLDDLQVAVVKVSSREGELLVLRNPVAIKNERINDWLSSLEREMKFTLAHSLSACMLALSIVLKDQSFLIETYLKWLNEYPAQIIVLAAQATWTNIVEGGLEAMESGRSTDGLKYAMQVVQQTLNVLADAVLADLKPITRGKCEHLITESVHQRDVIRHLIKEKVKTTRDFNWLYHMRYYFNSLTEDPLMRLRIDMANATFKYGYEYLGVPDRLVQTPLTDRCFLTLTQALNSRLGGSPFGPAGTGKTESVKALGIQLGRLVLVSCCDENFDFQAMGRILLGLCRVGAWGCFDEFNRLEERILSAVSQQIQTIQVGLRDQIEVELVNRTLHVHGDTGIFVTMNPGYAGRSNLPDNLKKLFRSVAMTKPDRELIAQVMLYSQGFRSAEILASKVVPFFNLCQEQLTSQSHYDFGLRSLKSVLVSAGNLKREKLSDLRQSLVGGAEAGQYENALQQMSNTIPEQEILIQSIRETVLPKLVSDDINLLKSLIADVFPGINFAPVNLDSLKAAIANVCQEQNLICEESWMEKVIQLYQIQNIHHGVMLVGSSGTGKTKAWQVLLNALENTSGIESISYVIDPKAMSKEALYGHLDHTTREWSDGLFTHILRKIVDNFRGESKKRHWIIFDGDVDPEWVENLNSVLDDNRILTLPNGERLNLPPNVRIIFEVESLKYATLATVSRCGMIWFSENVVSLSMLYGQYLKTLRSVSLRDNDEDLGSRNADDSEGQADILVQRICAETMERYMGEDGLITKSLVFSGTLEHIMDFTRIRAISTLFSLLNKSIINVLCYNQQHLDFPMSTNRIEDYVTRKMLLAMIWSFTGDSKLATRVKLCDFIRSSTAITLPNFSGSLIDWDVDITSGEWLPWQIRVPTIEIETHNVSSADVVIPTVDTLRHEEIIFSWLAEHKPLILCGPPGSGKTMTLLSALRKLPDVEVAGLNFSSATTPELLLRTFEQHCEYRKTPNGVTLAPVAIGRWLAVFCDEINLPAQDKYGTQRVISFMRQLIESGGFWRTSDQCFVRLERIQFVGACNPPTDPGRVPLTHRFMRHAPLIMVDHPCDTSLIQIYGTFSRAMLKIIPALRGFSEPLTSAMVELYLESQKRFTPDVQAHYIYSPRELTRWVRGIFEAIKTLEALSVEGLVRIWAHEALRLFQDRLVQESERRWTDDMIDMIAVKNFPTINSEEVLRRPILFSNWLSQQYLPIKQLQLREFVKARLKIFYEEELDVPLVLFNDVLEHVLRIDRVFRQMQGHLLLIGVSGSGKTTLSRFVAWMNGFSLFQIKVHNKYTAADFDEDLRNVLRRAGCKSEKICFIMDESNVLDPGFLERMNTLLANAEIPGLFEGEEHLSLMVQCREAAQREGLMLDTQEELYKWFTQQVMKNLHIVFTMNPPEGGLASRAATSPALFNRCVLDWFGDWSEQALFQVGEEFTDTLDLDVSNYKAPGDFPIVYSELPLPPTYRNAVVNAMVYIHKSLYQVNAKLSKAQGRHNHVTPRHYLDFIYQYVQLYREKREELEDHQRHLNSGLEKLHSTVITVDELRKSLAVKKNELENKNQEANEKLKRMLSDQQKAELKQIVSINMQQAIAMANVEIESRRERVMQELVEVEPMVMEAQNAVRNIKKQYLTEVRTMGNPPDAVKMAMESVCVMLGYTFDSWKTVQSIIRRDDFIPNIVNFNTERNITTSIRTQIQQQYMTNPNFNFEAVNRASKACGPLVSWVIAQCNYSSILDKVGPLREEVGKLESDAVESKREAEQVQVTLQDLEKRISTYKDEYAVLISEVQRIKSEMETVRVKVSRSLTLIDNLSSERIRWEQTSNGFEHQMSTIIGDVLVCAAHLAYSGYFDQKYRDHLMTKWTSHLSRSGIKFKTELSIPDFLSSADERMAWQSNALPMDDLCIENAIMLKRFSRYPLIIDPSGQATAFLMNQFQGQKIAVTSFLDDSFLKVLESSLRFGNPLLIQDVENLNPILNPVLNKELRKTGGRILIRLGSNETDFSPAFRLYMTTRDPSANFAPDICSRVTFVNFTVTRGSLQSQCLHQVLKAERPETEKKRNDLFKLQGEFQVRLRQLETALLQALSDSIGNILDDDNVLTTLETLKKEAGEVEAKVRATDSILKEVEIVTVIYTPLSQFCGIIYFILEQLGTLNHFYQFSLEFFVHIFEDVVLKNSNLIGITNPIQRLEILTRDLFNLSYGRASRSLLHEDRLTLATLLANAKCKSMEHVLIEDEYDVLVGTDVPQTYTLQPHVKESLESFFSADCVLKLPELLQLPAFKTLPDDLTAHADEWIKFTQNMNAEEHIPTFLQDQENIGKYLRQALLLKFVRPDRLMAGLSAFVEQVFGKNFLSLADLNLDKLVQNEVGSSTPIAFCSPAGYDASYRVEQFARDFGVKICSVAMGSLEGLQLAEATIVSASQTGSWVLLKNVHLASSWLNQLEKRIHTFRSHPNFRLVLTMEMTPKVPVSILRMSRIVTVEPPPGIKANIQILLGTIHSNRLQKGPAEKTRLYFLVSWMHAVIQGRLRYAPLGWTKSYEFNDSDFNCALDTVDFWTESVAKGRSNVDPTKIPWDALRKLMKETVYGGQIDNEFDQALLNILVDKFMTVRAFEMDYPLINEGSLLVPEGTRLDQFSEWVNFLPESEPPGWLGLPDHAERFLLETKGRATLLKIHKMNSLDEEDELSSLVENEPLAAKQPTWVRTLKHSVERWMSLLPKAFLSSTAPQRASPHNPLARFFEREMHIGSHLLNMVLADLNVLAQVLDGRIKQTNHIRALLSTLNRAIIPDHWKVYKTPQKMTVTEWICDLSGRLAQLEVLAQVTSFANSAVRLGKLFMAEAYVTATRQSVANTNLWSLEELVLEVDLDGSRNGFVINDLKIEGAEWVNGQLNLSSQSVGSKLPSITFVWVHTKDQKGSRDERVQLPLYLNEDRSDLLLVANVKMECANGLKFIERGVALLAN